MENLELKPLTLQESRLVFQTSKTIQKFFSSLKFLKNYIQPLISKQEASPLIEEASYYIVRIRSHLDRQDPSKLKLRPLEGNCFEFLHKLKENPMKDIDQFVRDLVHNALKTESGYEDGLTEKLVDKYIDQIKTYKRSQQGKDKLIEEARVTENVIEKEILETTEVMQELFTEEGRDKYLTEPQLEKMRQLVRGIAVVKQNFEELKEMKFTEIRRRYVEEKNRSQKEKQEEEEEEEVKMEEVKEKKVEEKKVEVKKELPEVDKESLVIVQKLAKDVETLKSDIEDLDKNLDNLSLSQLVENPKESDEFIQDLQKKCHKYSDLLWNDLMSLDQVVAGKEGRSIKKQESMLINELLDHVQNVDKKLKSLHTAIQNSKRDHEEASEKTEIPSNVSMKGSKTEEEPREPAQKKRKYEESDVVVDESIGKVEREIAKKTEAIIKRMEEEEKRKTKERELKDKALLDEVLEALEREEKGEVTTKEAKEQAKEKVQSEGEQKGLMKKQLGFADLRLEPDFTVRETPDAFVVYAYVPGLSKDDLVIQLTQDEKAVVVGGVRLPSKKDLEVMKHQLQERFGTIEDPGVEKKLLLQLGAGRFGTFQRTYRLNDNINVNEIVASYDNGMILVNLPKLRKLPTRVAPEEKEQQQYQRRKAPRFFDDNSLWW